MKNLFKLAVLLLVVFVTFSNTVKAQTPDSLILPREYSLFSEYHKNKDYESAVYYFEELVDDIMSDWNSEQR